MGADRQARAPWWVQSGLSAHTQLGPCDCAAVVHLLSPLRQVREGLHYNPYFPGGAIAMPKMLNDGCGRGHALQLVL